MFATAIFLKHCAGSVAKDCTLLIFIYFAIYSYAFIYYYLFLCLFIISVFSLFTYIGLYYLDHTLIFSFVFTFFFETFWHEINQSIKDAKIIIPLFTIVILIISCDVNGIRLQVVTLRAMLLFTSLYHRHRLEMVQRRRGPSYPALSWRAASKPEPHEKS